MVPTALELLQHNPLAFGTAPLSTGFWGNERGRAVDAVIAAIDAGFTWFDTAPLYGVGEAEERLGAALASRPTAVVGVATKVGRTLTADGEAIFDYSSNAIREQLTSSLRRLGRDRVEVAHIHDPEDHLDQAIDEGVATLVELRAEGLIGAISVGTNFTQTAARFCGLDEVDVVMLAGRITLLDRSGIDQALPSCKTAGIPLIAAAPFNSGLLAKANHGAWFDYGPAPETLVARARAMAAACERYGLALRAAALQFPLRHDGVLGVVAGMASVAEVEQNVADMATAIPDDLWAELDALANGASG